MNLTLIQPPPTYTMTTRAKNIIYKHIKELNLHVKLFKYNGLEQTIMTQALKNSK